MPVKVKLPKAPSPGEETLALHLDVNNIDYDREVQAIPGRKWRVDFVIGNLAVEINGGTWIQGRHNRGSSMEKEYEKLNALTAAGYSILQFTSQMVTDGRAIEQITQLVKTP